MTLLPNEFNLLNFWIKATYTNILLRDSIEDLKRKIELFTFIYMLNFKEIYKLN